MDEVEELMVEIRANTAGFAADVSRMRASFDSVLIDGFGRAGDVLERGLLSAIRRGSLGFEDLRRVALSVINDIAAQAVQSALGGLGGLGGGIGGGVAVGGGGLGNVLGALLGGALGLPGRATGGLVTAGRGYLVGERGPELFVPASSGRIDPGTPAAGGRDLRVSIQVVAPRGQAAPESLQRSGRQVARMVRKALTEF
jgi:phage-related minor tail protein